MRALRSLFAIVVHHQIDAVLFFEGKQTVLVHQTDLIGVELEDRNALGFRLGFGVADEKIHGGVEEVGHLNQGHNVRLCLVVFVFVYGLLGDSDSISQLLLTDPVGFSKHSQVFDHIITLWYYDNNQRVLLINSLFSY